VNRKRTLIAGVVGGLVHLAIVGGISVYLYGPVIFGYSTPTNSFALFDPAHVSIVFGSFVLGAVPAVLLVEYRLVTPPVTIAVMVAGLLLFQPGGLERQLNPQLPPIIAFYFLFWVGPLFVACIAGGLEYGVRRLLSSERSADPTAGP
jgi:hypothetical protein